MTDKQNKKDSSDASETDNKKTGLQSDPETLHTTDPQENMQGPVSSVVQSVKEKVEEDDEESKAEADRKKEKNM